MPKLFKITWKEKEQMPPYEANHALKSVLWNWDVTDAKHYFSYARHKQDVLKESWITTEKDAGRVISHLFKITYERDVEVEPDALIVEGKPTNMEEIKKHYETPTEKVDNRQKKESTRGMNLANIHINNTKQYDVVLTLDIKSVAKLKECNTEKIVMEIPFPTCIPDVMEKLEIQDWQISGITTR